MALTIKKRLFAEALDEGMSNKEAAIKAGYSEKTAAQAGSRLIKDEDVVRYMSELANKEPPPIEQPPQVATIAEQPKVKDNKADPKDTLLALLDDPDPAIALKAANALMPYMYARIAPTGKKETAKTNAIDATKTGRFATLSQQSEKIQ